MEGTTQTLLAGEVKTLMRKPHISALVAIAAISTIASGCTNADTPGGEGVGAPATEPADPTSQIPTSQPPTNQPSENTSESAPEETETSPEDTADNSNIDIVDIPPQYSWQEALDAALAEFDGQVITIELELRDSGRLEYEIELISADTEYEVRFDANTLEQISVDRDDLGSDAENYQNKIFDPAAMIALDDAAEIARGVQEGTITKWKLDGNDSGRVEYEFEIYPPGSRHDVEVTLDATDGTVLEVD